MEFVGFRLDIRECFRCDMFVFLLVLVVVVWCKLRFYNLLVIWVMEEKGKWGVEVIRFCFCFFFIVFCFIKF